MDLKNALRELYAEKKLLDRAIAQLEMNEILKKSASGTPKSSSGRRSMPPEERLQVSRRMTEYWAKRRQQEEEDAKTIV